MTLSDTSKNNKPVRRRSGRSKHVNISVERVEHLIVEVKNAPAISQLLEAVERRIAIVENGMPAVGGLTAQSARLGRVEAAVFKSNGAAHSIR